MSLRPASSPAALGLTAGVVTTILGTTLAPHFPVTAGDLFARAVLLLGIVFAAAFITTYAGFSLRGERGTPHVWRVSFGAAMTVLWLPPLLISALQQSLFTVMLWPVFLFQTARFLASLGNPLHERSTDNSALQSPAFPVLTRDFPFASTIIGALLLQAALFAAISSHDEWAAFFYLFGTAAVGWRALQMFLASPDQDALAREKIAPVLGTATLLTAFAWLPFMSISGPAGPFPRNGGSGGPLTTGSQPSSESTSKPAHATPSNATAMDWL